MALNVSYFLETLPETFDVWNTTVKWDYFVTYLEGFLSLSDSVKDWLTEEVTHEDIVELYSNIENEQQNLSWNNGTSAILEYMYK